MSRAGYNLPGVLAEIADLVGIDAALDVAGQVGGTRVFIPRRPGPNSWLIQTVGAEKAAAICEHFASERAGVEVDIPVGPRGSYNRERAQRARRIADLRAQGLQPSEIARQAGITRRGAQLHLARSRDRDPNQGDFEF